MATSSAPYFRYDITVPASAIDENGHLNNVEYVRLMQVVAIAHANHTPCTQATTSAGATWIARSHKIEYLQPAFQGEQLAILTWVSNLRRVRSLRKYKFFRLTDQAVIATGETSWVFVDTVSGKPLAIPETVSTAFEIVPEDSEPVSPYHSM